MMMQTLQEAHEEVAKLKKQLEEQVAYGEKLKRISNILIDDLLERAPSDLDGTRAVNVSTGVWGMFCDTLGEQPSPELVNQFKTYSYTREIKGNV